MLKAIIVGGGPVGLTTAHAFAKAGIDFVLLESYSEICARRGAGLSMDAVGMRVLDHLDLLDKFMDESAEVKVIVRTTHDHRDIGDLVALESLKEKYYP